MFLYTIYEAITNAFIPTNWGEALLAAGGLLGIAAIAARYLRPPEGAVLATEQTYPLLQFYSGPNFYATLQNNDQWFEGTHDYIQWLFPTSEPSRYHPEAPLLTPHIQQAFANTPALQTRMLDAFDRMLGFYGFQRKDTEFSLAKNAKERQRVWLTPNNHNLLRLTRILKSLTACGISIKIIQNFHKQLMAVTNDREYGKTRQFWSEAIKPGVATQRQSLIDIYQETRSHWSKSKTQTKPASICTYDPTPVSALKWGTATAPFVDQRGATTVACEMVNNGLNPLVMDMANEHHPGGGVENGARAQEETLCRQSNLMKGLESVRYPFEEFQGVFVPQVQFFRQDGDYAWMRTPFAVDVMAIAAYNLNGTTTPKNYIEGMRKKIQLFLRTALQNGNDSVVLGALGCGAFQNNPETIAKIYYEILNDPEFKNRFKEVRFAIIPDHNDPTNQNVTAFTKKFR